MSLKKFPSHQKCGWRPSNTNDSDDSDCSSDSDATVQYIHKFLSRSKSSDSSPAHKSWQCGGVSIPPALGCDHAYTPYVPSSTNTVAANSLTSSNYHLMHHDYAERMNEQLVRDTFNCDSGDVLNLGVRSDLPSGSVPEDLSSNSVNPPEMGPYEVPMAASLSMGKCPIKKRPWFMTTDPYAKAAGRNESAGNFDGPCSSRSRVSDLIPPSLPRWSCRTSHVPQVVSTPMVSSSVPSNEVPSTLNNGELKLRLKRINLREAPATSYPPYTCSFAHSQRAEVVNSICPRATRDKIHMFQSLSLSPDARTQPGSSSQADPVIDDNSPEIQFISMEQPSSALPVLVPHLSDRMKRRKRRRMHLDTLGKTYVSDEVIVVDDGHQDQVGRSPQFPFEASVPGPSSHRKLNHSSGMNNVGLQSCGSVVACTSMSPGRGAEMQTVNATPESHMEVTASTDLPDRNVAITPTNEAPANSVSLVNSTPVPPLGAVTSDDGTTAPVADARIPAGVSSMTAVPGLVVSNVLAGTCNVTCGTTVGTQTPQGLGEVWGQPMLLDASNATECLPVGLGTDATPVNNRPAIENRAENRTANQAVDIAMEITNGLKARLMSLTSILECPVCLEFIGPPIHQCRRGHIVCGVCKPKLMYCPTCRTGFSEYRNLVAEMFAERLEYPCKNAHLGCDNTFTLKDKKEHESNCAFRYYKCILCPWKGLHPELLPHLMKDHPGKVGHGPEQEILLELGGMTTSANQNWIVSAMNEIFRVNFILAKRQYNMQIMGSVQFIGPRRRADDFVYTFEVKNEEFDQQCIFSRKTHSDLDKCYTYYTNGDGFFINNSLLFSSGDDNNKCILVKLVLRKKNV